MRLCALALAFWASWASAQQPAELRRSFEDNEQWLLNAVLSDDAQHEAYKLDEAAARTASAGEKAAIVKRWRRRLMQFAQSHKKYLETVDINKNAPTVESMVTPYERAVTMHCLNALPKDERQKYLDQIAKGNTWLFLFRDTVADGIRDARRSAARDLGKLLERPIAVAALQDDPPSVAQAPKKGALDQAEAAARDAAEAAGRDREGASRLAGKGFSGTPEASKLPVSVPGGEHEPRGKTAPTLAPPTDMTVGGFKVKAPPGPAPATATCRPNTPMNGVVGTLAKALGGPILGLVLGAFFGALSGGVVGALAGGIVGLGMGLGLHQVLGL